ncbi:MAG: M6 family metalloprotease domain-containing protein [Phycisphaerae bacterium]|nr:M6 family metalloprotease domain-containing protein [Phycisphaerae bacterium]
MPVRARCSQGVPIPGTILGRLTIALIAAVAMLWPAPSALAVPAHPAPAVVEQPDGTKVVVRLRGDERVHWHEDARGYPVTRSAATRQWVYAVERDGALAPTQHVVGRSDPRQAGIQMTAGRLPSAPADDAAPSSSPSRSSVRQPTQRASTSGTMKNLVLLVNFSDVNVAYTAGQYDDLFNVVGYTADGATGSVRDYYDEVSYGALTVVTTVVEPVTLNNGYAYYGQNDAWGWDLRPREMVEEALAKLDARGFDFSTVDGDGDGWVDCLTVVHAGRDEACSGNDPDYIWSHKWGIHSVTTYDGVKLYAYHTVPAQRGWDSSPATWGLLRIGVVCHEMGHILGLPDLYDTDYSSMGVGDFCLMAGGSWNGDSGSCPAHMSAWCKVELGWVAPTVISGPGSYNVAQVATNDQIYKIQGDLPANEYFLVENRQGVGFDAALPGALRGLMIWHVDENRAGNTDENHYKVDVEEASGPQHLQLDQNYGNDLDYFRNGNATTFTDETTPSNVGYGGTPLGLNIVSVSATGATMSFSVVDPDGSTVAIAGYVKTAGGDPVQGVDVDADNGGGSDATDADGFYQLYVTAGWSGSVTPSRTGGTFVPVSRNYVNVTENQANQDFEITIGTGTLSVAAQDHNGDPVSGAIIVNGQTKATGSWSDTVWVGDHTVQFGPVAGYVTPDDQSVAVLESQTTNVIGTYLPVLGAEASAEPDVILPGETAELTVTGVGGVPGYDYAWNTGQTTATITVAPSATTAYTATVTDSLGQEAQATVQVIVATPVSATAMADCGSIAAGDSCGLIAGASGGVAPYSYRWSNGKTGDEITVAPTKTTTYTVTVTDALGQEDQASVQVQVVPSLTASVTAEPDFLLPGDASLLTASASGGQGPYFYRWNDGRIFEVVFVVPSKTTTYTVTVTDTLGQEATASVQVQVASTLAVTAEASPSSVQAGQSTTLSAAAAGGVGPYTYVWNTGATWSSVQASPAVPTTYSVTARDSLGQTANASVTVNVTQVAGEIDQTPPAAACFAPVMATGLMIVIAGFAMAGRQGARRGRFNR